MTAPTLTEAFEDERLFGLEVSPRWRRVLADVGRHRINVWCMGRRARKTHTAAAIGVYDCLFRPDLDGMVRPGERRYSAAIATNIAQARQIIAAARSIVEASPLLAEMIESVTEDRILFRNGTAFVAFPCSSRGARGWPINTLILDEAAHFVSETDGYQTADRVWEAMVPSTAQFGDAARVIVASTPYGTEGFFADLYGKAESGELPGAVAHRASTAEMNPAIDPEILEVERKRDPRAFDQEYLAIAGQSGDSFIDWTLVRPPVKRGPLPPSAGKGWTYGADPAFSRDNFGAVMVGHDHHDRRRLIVARVEAYPAGRAFPGPLPEIVAQSRRYGAKIISDQHAQEPIADYLRQRGVPARILPLTAESKSDVFSELRARLEDGRLELPDHPGLIAELKRLRTKFTANRASVEIPRVGSSHGDMAVALALAVWALRKDGGSRGQRIRSGGYETTRARYRPSEFTPIPTRS